MKNYKLTIPKPCHEDWEKMTVNKKGRFCDSCSNTVIDFTEKSLEEIQDFVTENIGVNICGYFKKRQLDSLVIQIPDVIFQQRLSFQKIFILSLLLTMGTVLFSCKSEGRVQKIDNIEVIDNITKEVVDTLKAVKKDSVVKRMENNSLPKEIDQLGVQSEPSTDKIESEEEIIDVVFGGISTYEKPYFKNSSSEKFDTDLRNFATQEMGVLDFSKLEKGKHKIIIKFTINKLGNFESIMIEPKKYICFKEQIIQIFEKVTIIPAKQQEKPMDLKYSLPITFHVN